MNDLENLKSLAERDLSRLLSKLARDASDGSAEVSEIEVELVSHDTILLTALLFNKSQRVKTSIKLNCTEAYRNLWMVAPVDRSEIKVLRRSRDTSEDLRHDLKFWESNFDDDIDKASDAKLLDLWSKYVKVSHVGAKAVAMRFISFKNESVAKQIFDSFEAALKTKE